jgi:L-alanine-DL-glutamate epimerase-like enolase superfamily enzyme
MRISQIKTRRLLIPYSQPFHWAHGVVEAALIVLVEVHTDDGVVGYGESMGFPSAEPIEAYLRHAASVCIGEDPFANARLMASAYRELFQAGGTCSAPRFAGQVLSGLEMALWDVMGKASGRPAHALLGGAVRDDIAYFGFAQGSSAEEIAADAACLARNGFDVIYIKVGLGDDRDLETAAAVRTAIGPEKRLRVDANEQWTLVQAARMIRNLVPFEIEVIEQPTRCESVTAMAQLRFLSPIAIAADQAVFTPFDAYDVCRQQAADLIVVGLHESGGLTHLLKIAHVAEAAGINICLHGLYESGITTCAANQLAATITNLDDANQHMTRFLAWDIVLSPDLEPKNGRLPILPGPGLGFEIDWDAVERAERAMVDQQARHPL